MNARLFARAALFLLLVPFISACQFEASPMDIRSLQERTTPRDGLACPPGMCAVMADFDAPRFRLSPADLMTQVEKVILKQPRTRLHDTDDTLHQRVFVQRTRIFRFPDTIWMQAVADGEETALLVYSRSNIGYWDMATNKRRVRRFAQAIEDALKGEDSGGSSTAG